MLLYIIITNFLFSIENDSLKSYKSDEVKVETHHHYEVDQNRLKKILNSTDDLLQRSSQITMIRRANFALEPTIRGLSNERTNITIDGMHIFGACVDKMDPASNYIEIQNIEALDVCTPQNHCGCGGNNRIDFKTTKSNYVDKFSLSLDSYYASAANNIVNGIKSNYSNENFSNSSNFIYKNANDYRAGDGKVLGNSGYSKFNFTNDSYFKINGNNEIGISFLGDVSNDVGYPALIMDTRVTETYLLALKHNYTELKDFYHKSESKLYFNSIYHLMDDYDRSEEEIKNRIVMPNMYMPMVGKTYTFGFINNYQLLKEDYSIGFYNDVYSMYSDANMKMIMLDDDSNIMNLKNIANANLLNYKLNISYLNYEIENIELSTGIGLNIQYANLLDSKNASSFKAFINLDEVESVTYAPNLQSSFKYLLKNSSIQLSAAYSERNPNRMELYSYYIYNPMDNSFYTGNPNLKTEKQYNIEVSYNYYNTWFNGKVNIFNNYFDNYIIGVLTENQMQNENFPQFFREYKNTGQVNIYGIEFMSNYEYNNNFNLDLSLKYNRAYSITLDDNLPLINPLVIDAFINYQTNKFKAILDFSFNDIQNKTSNMFLFENRTKAFFIMGLRFDYKVLENFNLTVGVDNIFDTYYVRHTSINDLPDLGRNIYAKINFIIK